MIDKWERARLVRIRLADIGLEMSLDDNLLVQVYLLNLSVYLYISSRLVTLSNVLRP